QEGGPQPPAAPPAAPQVTVPGVNGGAPVAVGRDVNQLKSQLDILTTELKNVTERRKDIAQEIRRADGASQAGLESQLRVIDEQIIALERQIGATTTALAGTAPDEAVQAFETVAPQIADRAVEISENLIPISFFVCALIAPVMVAWARRIWRGTASPSNKPDTETVQRIARIEQSVDAIALELERVSEGQRFVTKLMSEQRGLGAGAAAPIAVPVAEAVERR
ncbi:MAG: hypothetical protein SFW08_08100, partial [Gemmatimonadaceae bacterium]|nr:hypothetical protein [Gemmatimonadaceae bacterium]